MILGLIFYPWRVPFLKRFFRSKEVSADQKQISLNKKLLETILGRIGDAVCIFDRNFNILFQSPLHIKWFDKLEEFICFKRVDEIKPNRTVKTITKPKPDHPCIWKYPHSQSKMMKVYLLLGSTSFVMYRTRLNWKKSPKSWRSLSNSSLINLELKTIIGNSKPIQKVLEGVHKISKLDTVVYIQGDTGTGKELVAQAIHKLSLRFNKPFLLLTVGPYPNLF